MGLGILVPVDPMIFLIIAFVVIVGGACCAILGDSNSEKRFTKAEFDSFKKDDSPNKIDVAKNDQYKRCPNCKTLLRKKAKKCPRCDYKF